MQFLFAYLILGLVASCFAKPLHRRQSTQQVKLTFQGAAASYQMTIALDGKSTNTGHPEIDVDLITIDPLGSKTAAICVANAGNSASVVSSTSSDGKQVLIVGTPQSITSISCTASNSTGRTRSLLE